MKKLFLCLVILSNVLLFSQQLEIIEGNSSFLKDQKEINVILKFENVLFMADDISEKQYLENRKEEILNNPKKTEIDWVNWLSEWDRYKHDVYCDEFIKGFNAKSKSVSANRNSDAKYVMIIETIWVYPGWYGGMIVQLPKITAKITFVESIHPSNILLKINVNKYERVFGGDDLKMEYGRIGSGFEAIGRELGKKLMKN